MSPVAAPVESQHAYRTAAARGRVEHRCGKVQAAGRAPLLASVFELLTDSRAQVLSVNAAIEAQRDFWIAETNLQAAINGSGSGGASTEIRGQAVAEAPPQH